MSTQFLVQGEQSGSLAITVEVLAPECYSDLIRRRRPGRRFKAASGNTRAIDVSGKDLLVLTRFKREPLGALAAAVDRQLDGFITASIEQSGFEGKQGETLVLALEEAGLGSGNPRKVLVVGLGDRALYGQFIWCGLVSMLIAEAADLDAEQVLLALNDLPQGEEWLTASKMASVLKCRVREYLNREVEHGRLKKIRLLVSSERKEAVASGLANQESLCVVCSHPYL